jgi:hypothetical protein
MFVWGDGNLYAWATMIQVSYLAHGTLVSQIFAQNYLNYPLIKYAITLTDITSKEVLKYSKTF